MAPLFSVRVLSARGPKRTTWVVLCKLFSRQRVVAPAAWHDDRDSLSIEARPNSQFDICNRISSSFFRLQRKVMLGPFGRAGVAMTDDTLWSSCVSHEANTLPARRASKRGRFFFPGLGRCFPEFEQAQPSMAAVSLGCQELLQSDRSQNRKNCHCTEELWRKRRWASGPAAQRLKS